MLQQYFSKNEDGIVFNIAVNKTFNTCGDGYWSNVAKTVFVESITMFIGVSEDDEDDLIIESGDLCIKFATNTWNTATEGLIYTDSTFIAQVRAFLIDAGFNADAVNDITYSEQGMQGADYVSCDAYEFANYAVSIV